MIPAHSSTDAAEILQDVISPRNGARRALGSIVLLSVPTAMICVVLGVSNVFAEGAGAQPAAASASAQRASSQASPDRPTTAPTTARVRGGGEGMSRGGGFDRGNHGRPDGPGRGGPRGGGWREPTPQEWEEAVGFLQTHSPRRLELYERAVGQWKLRQSGQSANSTQPATQATTRGTTQPATQSAELPREFRGARARIYGRVQMLRQMEQHDPRLYALALEQFKLEDQIIGSLHEARQASEAGNEAAHVQAQQAAAEAIRHYAEGSLAERAARIERMREELSREQQRLEQDQADLDKLMARLRERFERSLPGDGRDSGSEPGREKGRGDGRGGRGEESGG